MLFKQIVHFEYPTLNKFIVQIQFVEDFVPLDLKLLADFAGEIDSDFPIKPKFTLMPKPGETIELGPLIFRNNEEATNIVQIGRNMISFIITKYKHWAVEFEKIKNTINQFNYIFKLPKVQEIRMTYINHFDLPKVDFNFSKYFTFPIDPEEKWSILYNDFFLGIVPFDKDSGDTKKKMILRLRTLGRDKENYNYSFESILILRNLLILVDDVAFENYLEDGHSYLEHYFIEFLTKDYQNELKLKYAEFSREE